MAARVQATLATARDVKAYTLAFVLRTNAEGVREILLGTKKRGFGLGKTIGFGGKIEPSDKSIPDAAARELMEEANIVVSGENMQSTGTLLYTFTDRPQIMHMHVYTVTTFEGEPSESDEMRPAWFPCHAIPYDDMWADERFWLPSVLAGHRVFGQFDFADDEVTILDSTLDIVGDNE
ncbi:hypothetical protein SPRG_02930 [Saprolegnia parasitica CBS 223.65]|uniref:Oxidized purine nucleoside triphosphate hydrolase n=1 Tax=Saprolegnia parasitica (strain CBS 223.65) TaxID=695850 RepID=A0A067CPL1_SAPPC|nr:hypothetical protein SPRG_02930 [Saprolegnia parasitica CBS 223.65]KDO32453.1 hypothetical protein SPRG_02930 [Saprolegnia parasitica CBS 223.65]|eukprot:XP_012196904.1 hypothetical protein SPRG_02930 [Saprolegnia parasitica CBS 223.65]